MTRNLIGVALLFLIALPARAQEGNKFALGGSFTARATQDASARGGQGPGIKWRFRHDTTGWGWHWGLDWYALDVDQRLTGTKLNVGELKVRPFMGGYGYTRVVGPIALTADVIGGYAFTSFVMTTTARDTFASFGGGNVEFGGTPVVKPEIEMWMDLSRKVGLTINAGYMVARPRVTMPTIAGDRTSRFPADSLEITFGTVYRIF